MARIIVADDEPDVVELIRFILEKEGHEVLSASNGREALIKIEEHIPDLLILDVMMPEMDGYSVTAKLAEREATRKIPIMILTAKGQMRDLFAMAANVTIYMEKPFDPKGLREKVRALLLQKP